MLTRVRTCLLGMASVLPFAAAQAIDAGVSIQISQPGVYGRVDIGRLPKPEVVVAQPVTIQRAPAVKAADPVYLWVPPGHRKNWGKHCAQYGACGVPVYFVQDRWYEDHVKRPRKERGAGKDEDRKAKGEKSKADHGKGGDKGGGHGHGGDKGKGDKGGGPGKRDD